MKKQAPPHELLLTFWEHKKAKDKKFSLRYLAAKVGVSPAYLSKVFAGKKPLPLARVKAVAKALDLDLFGSRQLERAVLRAQSGDADTSLNLTLRMGEGETSHLDRLPSEDYEPAADFYALEEWYYLPILELVTCEGFDPGSIHARLGLKEEVAARAWQRLVTGKLVEQAAGGRWQKSKQKIRFASGKIDSRIQRHHLKMLQKAGDEINYRKTEDDFQKRLILGASVATNEKSFLAAKKYLEESLFRAGDILAQGKAEKVYYLAFQLFPLSK